MQTALFAMDLVHLYANKILHLKLIKLKVIINEYATTL